MQADLALSFSLQVMKQHRTDLKLVIMSATLFDDLVNRTRKFVQKTLELQDPPACVKSSTELFPVHVKWHPILVLLSPSVLLM